MEHRLLWNVEAESILITRDPVWGGALAYFFGGRPMGTPHLVELVSNVELFTESVAVDGFYPVTTSQDDQGTWRAEVPRTFGAAAREIAQEAIAHVTDGISTNPYGGGSVFLEECEKTVTFGEINALNIGSLWELSSDEIEAIQGGSSLPEGAVQAYAKAFETDDFETADVEGYFVAELAHGQSLQEWYESEYVDEQELRVTVDLLGSPTPVTLTFSEVVAKLASLHMSVEVDTVSLEQEFTEQDGFVFVVH